MTYLTVFNMAYFDEHIAELLFCHESTWIIHLETGYGEGKRPKMEERGFSKIKTRLSSEISFLAMEVLQSVLIAYW